MKHSLVSATLALLAAACAANGGEQAVEGADGGIFIYENFASERMIDAYISLGGDGGSSTNDVAVA